MPLPITGYGLASKGKNIPRVINVVSPRNTTPRNMRMIFTDNEPTLLPALSKYMALRVQQTAVSKEAISPTCDCKGIEQFYENIVYV